jgi:hypothetical protein
MASLKMNMLVHHRDIAGGSASLIARESDYREGWIWLRMALEGEILHVGQ